MFTTLYKSWTVRYTFHKIWQARPALPRLHVARPASQLTRRPSARSGTPSPRTVLQSVEAGASAAREVQGKLAGGKGVPSDEIYAKVQQTVQSTVMETFSAPLTQVIKFTGPAMSPLLNRKAASTEPSTSHEFLLTHKLVEPSPANVLKGDVVAFRHPLAGVEPGALMVRRVVAAGGDVLESDTAATHQLAPETVWVAAENEELEPPHVEDSRTFGPVQLSNVVGRCIYAIRSKADRDHIANNDKWAALDRDIVSVELTDELLEQLDSDAAPAPSA